MPRRKSSLEVVTTPTFNWLAEYARDCSKRMLVGSPYVNDAIIGLTRLVPSRVSRTLVTRTDIRDFAVGSSNLDTLCTLAREGMVIRSLNNLHAKIYIFDDSKALVTSANATNAGMWRNLECGLSTDDRRVVRQLSKSLLSRFDEEERRRRMPKILNLRELEALYPQIEAIKVTIPERPQDISQNSGLQVGATFSIPDRKAFLSQFGGWRRLTVEGVLDMPGEHFTLAEFYELCEPRGAKRFPTNTRIKPKLRQQLQDLRDRGYVMFLGSGRYRRTMEQG